ncbi:hypothetical protein ACJX0J_026425, partial [Zea mays]
MFGSLPQLQHFTVVCIAAAAIHRDKTFQMNYTIKTNIYKRQRLHARIQRKQFMTFNFDDVFPGFIEDRRLELKELLGLWLTILILMNSRSINGLLMNQVASKMNEELERSSTEVGGLADEV